MKSVEWGNAVERRQKGGNLRIHRKLFWLVACGLVVGLTASAQSRKPGLYVVTTTMTWQKSPFPGMMAHMGRKPHTTKVCVTQAEIDKYGTAPPRAQRDCKIENVVKKANGMTAEEVCTGPMSGKGDIQASWTDATHTTTKVHYVGAMKMGSESKPIEWTVESASVYEGADCGKVKPMKVK